MIVVSAVVGWEGMMWFIVRKQVCRERAESVKRVESIQGHKGEPDRSPRHQVCIGHVSPEVLVAKGYLRGKRGPERVS